MVDFRMRGSDLFDYCNHRLATVKGNDIFDEHERLVASIHENTILDEHRRRMATVHGNDVLDISKNRIASVDEIRHIIRDSMGGVCVIALWMLFVRKESAA
ncbi:MAG: hypothetical protein NTV54_06295 [Ignavibacteriales bacterium]|nr:hypothetical protein [Ignavibacteriales bacterium]